MLPVYYSYIEIVTHVILEFNLDYTVFANYMTIFYNLDERVEMRQEIVDVRVML